MLPSSSICCCVLACAAAYWLVPPCTGVYARPMYAFTHMHTSLHECALRARCREDQPMNVEKKSHVKSYVKKVTPKKSLQKSHPESVTPKGSLRKRHPESVTPKTSLRRRHSQNVARKMLHEKSNAKKVTCHTEKLKSTLFIKRYTSYSFILPMHFFFFSFSFVLYYPKRYRSNFPKTKNVYYTYVFCIALFTFFTE